MMEVAVAVERYVESGDCGDEAIWGAEYGSGGCNDGGYDSVGRDGCDGGSCDGNGGNGVVGVIIVVVEYWCLL